METGSMIRNKNALFIGLYGHRFILQSHVCRWPNSLTTDFCGHNIMAESFQLSELEKM